MARSESISARMRGPFFPALLVASIAIAGCEPIRQTHGYVPADAYVERIKVGEDSRADIVSKIGRPSTTAAFQNDEWYYVSRTTTTRAFFAPKPIEQRSWCWPSMGMGSCSQSTVTGWKMVR